MTAPAARRSAMPAHMSTAKRAIPVATAVAAPSTHCSDQSKRGVAHDSATKGNNDDETAAWQRMATTGPTKHCVEFPAAHLRFSSRYDSGSMQSVTQVAVDTFHVAVAEDAAASGVSTGYTTWFYFELETLPAAAAAAAAAPASAVVCGGASNTSEPVDERGLRRDVRLVLTNMNGQKGLYANGYKVMYCAVDADAVAPSTNSSKSTLSDVDCVFDDEKRWQRVRAPLMFEKYTVAAAAAAPHASSSDDDGTTDATDTTTTTAAADTPEPDTTSSNTNQSSKPKLKPKPKPKQELKVTLAFTHTFAFTHERVRFAFCYPHSYSRVQRQLAALDQQFGVRQPSTPTDSNVPQQQHPTATTNIYYHRELLTHSLEGLRVDLVTISSRDALLPLDRVDAPFASSTDAHRARTFDSQQKRTVVISARVHPAETPASFMLDGMLALLLHATDANAVALRRHFVFKIVPTLNPDGVTQGFYRTDTRGVNLNRVYEAPSQALAPTVFAIRALLLSIVEANGGAGSEQAAQRVVYLDLHAHANRRGCFVYGNNLLSDGAEAAERSSRQMQMQVELQLFARLIALHSPYFDYLACSFERANMTRNDVRDIGTATTSRAGCSRVALFRATGLPFIYTIECNYNEGRRNNMRHHTAVLAVPSSLASMSSQALVRHVAPTSGSRLYIKYAPAEWSDVGVGSLVALLDLFQLPGRSKAVVAESPFRSLDGIRKSLWAEIKSAELRASAGGPSSSSSNSSTIISSSSSKDARRRAKSVGSATTLTTTRRPSSKM